MNLTPDVLIVGAGPTGLALACELQRIGIPAALFDRQAAGANTSRAAVIHSRTLEVLEPLDVTRRLVARGIQVPTFTVRDRGRVLTTISFRDLPTAYPYALMCPQDRTEAVLVQRLGELGGEVRRPAEALIYRDHGSGVSLTVRAEGGVVSTFGGRWLIGCDGAHSIVREQAGIEFEGGAYQEVFVLADVEMDWPISREEVALFLAPAGLVVVAPLPSNHFRVVATVAQADAEPGVAQIQAILNERGPESGVPRIERLVWSSRFYIQHRVSRRLRKGNVVLAGDAAHVHSPAGGQGMNTGIQDAVTLAHALEATLRRDDPAPLEAWERERLEVARGVVAMTDRLTRAATLHSPLSIRVRNALLSLLGHSDMVLNALATRLAELDH